MVGAIAAVLSKAGENVVPQILSMLKKLRHRGVDACGIATPKMVTTSGSIDELKIRGVKSSAAIGHNLCRILPRDRSQPIRGKGFSLVFDGRFFPSHSGYMLEELAEKLEINPRKNAKSIIENHSGSFTFAIACSNKSILAGRDVVGTTPFYYGENETTYALASERKGLWSIGITDARSFPPGYLGSITADGFSFEPVRTIENNLPKKIEMKFASKDLLYLLFQSIKDRVTDLEKVHIAFSGGLDSSVLATLTKLSGVDVHLITVGLNSHSEEIRHAENTAKVLELPLCIRTYTVEDVKKILPKVVWLLEEPSLLNVGIAIPFYWVSETVSNLGYNVLLAGQGSDELFGGYQRYLREYRRGGVKAVRRAIYKDVASSHEINFQRDNKISSYHKVELRLPFADIEVMLFSLGLPVALKIESESDCFRKRILRQVAKMVGFPDFVVYKRKKAIQYSTGVSKAIKRLAKNEGLSPREYIHSIFDEVKYE